MVMQFTKAKAESLFLRMALIGPSGGGKTWTALSVAEGLCGGRDVYTDGDIAVLDSERRSALKYAKKEGQERGPGAWEFGYISLESFHPERYIEGIRAAEAGGFKVLVIDSLSHAWMGKDGTLELVDKAAKRNSSHNSFNAWREVTPIHNALVDAIMSARLHVIFTLRVKTEYVVEEDPHTHKKVPRKVGLSPVMRDGIEYEADIVAEMDQDNNLTITKTRCPALTGATMNKPGDNLARAISAWLTGAPARKPEVFRPAQQAEPPKQATHHDGKDSPKNGTEFEQWAKNSEAVMVENSLCRPGELLEHMRQYAILQGLPEKLSQWKTAADFQMGMSECRTFYQMKKKPATANSR